VTDENAVPLPPPAMSPRATATLHLDAIDCRPDAMPEQHAVDDDRPREHQQQAARMPRIDDLMTKSPLPISREDKQQVVMCDYALDRLVLVHRPPAGSFAGRSKCGHIVG